MSEDTGVTEDTDTGPYDPEVVTKIDKMLHTLTDAQLVAIDALMTGTDQETAASAAGVSRATVNRWVKHHPEFQAELNRRRRQLFDQQVDRVRQIDNMALENLRQRIEAGDEKASELWLKMRGLAALDTSKTGPTSSDAIIGAQVDGRIREINRENLEALQAAASPYGPDRYATEETIEIEIAEKLGERTFHEALNSRLRETLSSEIDDESDGHDEDKNS